MAITQVLSAAVSGLRASELRADSAANNITNLNTPGYRASRVAQQTVVVSAGANLAGGSGVAAQLVNDAGGPDLATEVIRLIEAETVYKANAALFRTAAELHRESLNIVA